MGNAPAEVLKIENFLSISYMEWQIQRLNVITGDMAAGKSLCMKLLKFFEDAIPNLLSSGYECFCKNMNKDNYFKHIAGKFNNIFSFSVTDPPKQKKFTITYTFSYKEEKFDMIIEGSNEENIVVKSSYIEKLLQEWGNLLQNNKELSAEKPEDLKEDSLIEFKNTLYNDVSKKFDGNFPVGTAFVPASRAALVVSSDYSDYYLKKYAELFGILKTKQGKNDKNIDDILKAQIIIDDELYLKSNDGRKVPINKASSGQQEIVYVLMQLDRLGNNGHNKYGKSLSLFIEEPSAHLFPLEQMQIINYIVQVYNDLKNTDKPVRYFITTHSPYILNSLNNILRKGALLKKYSDKAEIINRDERVAKTPVLSAEEVSAYFIEADGKGEDMFDPKDKDFIYPKKIAAISRMIDEIDGLLSDIDDEFQE